MAFEDMRATPVAGGHNKGLNFGDMVADSEITGDGYCGGGGGTSRNWSTGTVEGITRKGTTQNLLKKKKKTTAALKLNPLRSREDSSTLCLCHW